MIAAAFPSEPDRNERYRELERLVRARGLLDPDPAFHTRSFIVVLVGVSACLVGLFAATSPELVVVMALCWGIVSVRGGIVMHDACHQQIYRSRAMANVVRFLTGNLLLGLSASWWTFEHSRHHANPNVPGRDPDIGVPHLAFSHEQASRKGPMGRWAVRHQAVLFLPLFMLQAIYLRWASTKWLLTRRSRYRSLESALVALHAVGYLSVVLAALPGRYAVVFVLIHQATFGLYAGSIFAPGHKGMPLSTKPADADLLSFQVETTRNIRANVLTDLWYGGLHYQVEHHLFPRMSRSHFAEVRPIVRAFCRARGIEVTEISALDTYRDIIRHLHSVAIDA